MMHYLTQCHKKGVQYGKSTFWYENGQKKREYFVNKDKDNKVYRYTEWHENGQIREKGIYDLNEKGQIPKIRLDEDGNEIERS